MYNLFKDAEKLIYRKPKVQDPRPDNVVFRLHYQYTFTVLSVCVILVTSYGYIDSAGVGTGFHNQIILNLSSLKVLQFNVWRTRLKYPVMF